MHDYTTKFNSYLDRTLYANLSTGQQAFIRNISFRFGFTFQEFRQVVNACRDLWMWGEMELEEWWSAKERHRDDARVMNKSVFLAEMRSYLHTLTTSEKVYKNTSYFKPAGKTMNPVVIDNSEKKISGLCPVASDKTVCCRLQTIDTVENCVLGCSYCTIQTFYTDRTVINTNLREKLNRIEIEPGRYYHFGSGQASDSLALGNHGGILDDVCDFARNHPNVLLELKTKSKNINYFLENTIPPNMVCSWSVNPEVIIRNEEHFTASLEERLAAARSLCDRGIKVGFHFHPMIYYQGWETDYPAIARDMMERFTPQQVLFLSFGSITLIKPVIQKIRARGIATKTLQMEFVPDPLGKLTYPDLVKIKMYRKIHEAFKSWQNRVYMYLCMEKAEIWKQVFGFVYANNFDFEQDFARQTIGRISELFPEAFPGN
jgi:spore photoproduct lyase